MLPPASSTQMGLLELLSFQPFKNISRTHPAVPSPLGALPISNVLQTHLSCHTAPCHSSCSGSLSSRPQLIGTTVGHLILGHAHQVCLTVLHVYLRAGTVRSQTRWAGDMQPSFLLSGLSEPLTLLPKLGLHSASQPQIWLQQSFQWTISERVGEVGEVAFLLGSPVPLELMLGRMWVPPVPL